MRMPPRFRISIHDALGRGLSNALRCRDVRVRARGPLELSPVCAFGRDLAHVYASQTHNPGAGSRCGSATRRFGKANVARACSALFLRPEWRTFPVRAVYRLFQKREKNVASSFDRRLAGSGCDFCACIDE